MSYYPYSGFTIGDAMSYMEIYGAPTECDADNQRATPMGTEL